VKIEKYQGKLEEVPDLEKVKVTTAGNTIKIQSVSHRNRRKTVEKISADEYLVSSTGEVRTMQHSANRSQSVNSLQKTFARLRDLINANVTEPQSLRWITLTYADNMTDPKQLYIDCKNYHLRLNRYFRKNGIEVPQYIEVAEPQERGAWHIHELLIWNGKAPFIPTCNLEKLWEHGFVKIKKLDDKCDNIGAYLTPYLTDLEIDPEAQKTTISDGEEILERELLENGKKVRKKFVKGGRLYLYPPGMNLYRHSRGIKEPIVEDMTYFEAKEKVSGATKTFENSVVLTEDMFHSIIYTEYYNTKRK